MRRFVAVGDIHGCSQTLAKLLEILDIGPDDTFLSTGDLSSKGEDSRGVHSQLLSLEQRGVKLLVLLGNHELMLLAMQRMVGAIRGDKIDSFHASLRPTIPWNRFKKVVMVGHPRATQAFALCVPPVFSSSLARSARLI